MMSFIKKLFGGVSVPEVKAIPAEFPAYAEKAIQLITASTEQLDDKEILDLFTTEGIPETEATDLLLFLPIAFCRYLLTKVNWPDHYFEYISEHKQQKVLYSENLRYKAIQSALHAYLAGNFSREDYYKIAGRCASFHALNSLLLQNPDTKIEDVQVSPEYLVR